MTQPNDKAITLEQCQEIVAKKHFGLNAKMLVTGHKSSYFNEAAELYKSSYRDSLIKKVEAERIKNTARNYGRTYNLCLEKVIELIKQS